jgi:haloacetate dehalogenase
VRGKALPCGHFIPEEVPDLLLDEVLPFFHN